MPETESTSSKPETVPTYIKWYETSDTLESAGVLCSRSSPTPVISIGQGWVLATWDLKWDYWKIKWEKTENTFKPHFQLESQADLRTPLLLHLPALDFEGQSQWLANQGKPFSFTRALNQRVDQLLLFSKEKLVSGPGGTLFIITRPGIQEAVERNQAWRLILGYSMVEPEFKIPVQPMTSQPLDLWLPKWVSVSKPSDPIRVSRYTRPWVI